ncbi:MAG: hypothetical protein L0G66_03640, partial [Brevibacterium sp.]|nr:hypothetical protein [Brevibacterium sp.]
AVTEGGWNACKHETPLVMMVVLGVFVLGCVRVAVSEGVCRYPDYFHRQTIPASDAAHNFCRNVTN